MSLDEYIIDFYRTFGTFDCRASHFSLFDPPTADFEAFFLEKDAIYVGGGNTKSMLALWKEWKLDQHLKKAYEHGVVLSGISAGANCWFEECITDSIPGELTTLKCLGLLKGSCCPHYDSEEKRKPFFRSFIQSGTILSGIALEDHAAAHYINDALVKVVRANDTASAYLLSKGGDTFQEKRLEALHFGTLG